MGWSNKTPMTPRQVAEDVEANTLYRVLAAAIDAENHKRGLYDQRRPVADLCDSRIVDDMMGELVRAGLAEWTQSPLPPDPSGRRGVGLIRPTAKGRRVLQAAIDKDHEAKSLWGRIRRATAAGKQTRRVTAESIRDWKTILGAVTVLALLAVVTVRGCELSP